MDLAVLLVGGRQSWNSLSALVGALEVDPRFPDLEVRFAAPGPEAIASASALTARYGRVIVGFSFMTPDLPKVAAQVAQLRQALPRVDHPQLHLVAGGPHATASWRTTLALGFDYAVVGEGEVAFPELVWQLATGGRPEGVRGVASQRADGAYLTTGRARPIRLDDYPPFSPRYRRHGPIEITRGCPHRCRFCATPFLTGRHPRHRSPREVLRWVESCLANGVDQIRFIAPNSLAYGSADSTPHLEWLEELLRATSELAGRRNTFLGSFPSEVRPDSVTPEAVELVARYCGNDNLVIGAQSGSPRMLERMQRGHTVEDIYRAVEIARAAGLIANVDIIFGLPGETLEDRRLTLDLIDRLTERGARIHSHTFMPLPGAAWGRCPPGRIDKETERRLGALALRGLQYGTWQKQAAKAQGWCRLLAQLEGRPLQP